MEHSFNIIPRSHVISLLYMYVRYFCSNERKPDKFRLEWNLNCDTDTVSMLFILRMIFPTVPFTFYVFNKFSFIVPRMLNLDALLCSPRITCV